MKLRKVLSNAAVDPWLREGSTLVFCASAQEVERLKDALLHKQAANEVDSSSTSNSTSSSSSSTGSSDRNSNSSSSSGGGSSNSISSGSNCNSGATPVVLPIALHTGLSPSERKAAIDAFLADDTGVMIATDIVARGLDFPALRHVVLYVQEKEGRGRGCGGGRERGEEGDGLNIRMDEWMD